MAEAGGRVTFRKKANGLRWPRAATSTRLAFRLAAALVCGYGGRSGRGQEAGVRECWAASIRHFAPVRECTSRHTAFDLTEKKSFIPTWGRSHFDVCSSYDFQGFLKVNLNVTDICIACAGLAMRGQ